MTVISDPEICGGEPIIQGTRIPVRVIVSHVNAGETYAEIIRQFPNLSEADIEAAIQYGA